MSAPVPHPVQSVDAQEPRALAQARADMYRQIERLERQLSATGLDWARRSYPAQPQQPSSPPRPALLDLQALEHRRDALFAQLAEIRDTATEVRREQAATAYELEQMLAAPERYKLVRIRNEQLGLPGCKAYYSKPRLGLIGMLAGWWHVKISSGCP
ncbi:MAG TPA: hypothetical protein VLJ42_11225 [Solirubrobacteraceae bacterium]|nr:hypothetical protein [Solirubrobacteraceae bacterium]